MENTTPTSLAYSISVNLIYVLSNIKMPWFPEPVNYDLNRHKLSIVDDDSG